MSAYTIISLVLGAIMLAKIAFVLYCLWRFHVDAEWRADLDRRVKRIEGEPAKPDPNWQQP